MTRLHREQTPFETGHLAVGDGHEIYFEQSGRRDGRAFLFLHGGPGSGSAPRHRRYADPAIWRTIQFDQRGCGRSTPLFSLTANTTADLVADMEKLREHVGVDSWTVCGNSWGSTLALAYAQAHPGRVEALIVLGVFTGAREELDWFHAPGGAGAVFPDACQTLMDGVPDAMTGPRFIDWALERMRAELANGAPVLDRLADPGASIADLSQSLIYRWSAYEEALSHMQVTPEQIRETFAVKGRDWLIAHSLIEAHYFANGCFVTEGQLLRDAPMLTMPVHIIQSRYDMVCPPRAAWRLKQALPHASLTIVADHGHAMGEPSFAALRDTLT